jgi:hypothetical protein
MSEPKILAIDPNDAIVACLAKGAGAHYIDSFKDLQDYDPSIPVIFRSMAQRKTVAACEKQNRSYIYIDTGYIGNMQKRKDWHRIVVDGMQHSQPRRTPGDRFYRISEKKQYLKFPGWRKNGKSILLVTPSEKPCKFYGINRDIWVDSTINFLKQHTDRPIIVRDKTIRRDRVGSGSIYSQLIEDDIFAVVTYNSIAATESIGFGVPCFTLAPNAADKFCLKDLSKIEYPLYADAYAVREWQDWLGYCQYTTQEMVDGTALKLIKEYEIK